MTWRATVPAWALTIMMGVFIMMLLPAGADNSWPMFQGTPEHCGFSSGPLSSEHSTLWSARIGNGNLTAPVAQGGSVFIGSSDGNLYSVWEVNGSVGWDFDVGGPISSVPAIDSNLVYVVSEEGRLCALGAQGGGLVWEFRLPENATYSIPLTLSGNSLYIGSSHGDILRFQVDGPKNVVWAKELNITIFGAITIGDGRAYVATEDGDIVAFDVRDGAMVWSTRPGPSVVRGFAIAFSQNLLYFGTRDNSVVCLDSGTGGVVWSPSVKGDVSSSTSVGAGLVAMGTANGFVIALDAATGVELWRSDVGGKVVSSPAIVNDTVVAETDAGGIAALNAASGSLLWTGKASGSPPLSPAIDSGLIIIATEDGNITVFGRPGWLVPQAILYASASRVSVGDEVQFTASASPSSWGSPVNGYFYNFGDGESTGWVADASVNHSFSGKGRFLVTLKARDADAAESASSAVTIDVFNFRPEVSIEPPAKGYAERPARLAANATDEDGTVVLYEWDFDGDGTVDLSGASMNAVIHIYPSDGIYKPILRVTDDNGSSSMASGSITVLPQPAAHPGSAPSIPLAVAAIMPLGILAAVGAFAATETGRYKLLALLFVPLFTRIKKEEVLDNYTRGLIHGFIIANPGDHYSAIKDALGLSNGNLAYHLKTLEREGIVQSRMDGMYRRFFPANEALLPRDGKYFSVQNRIVQQIRENPGISQKEISGKVGASRSTVNYHISVLATTRKIRVEKIDQWTRCFIYEERKN